MQIIVSIPLYKVGCRQLSVLGYLIKPFNPELSELLYVNGISLSVNCVCNLCCISLQRSCSEAFKKHFCKGTIYPLPRRALSLPEQSIKTFLAQDGIIAFMETIHTILRSNVGKRYLLYVNESLDKSMDIHSWDRESVKKVIT
ncbi:MAG: hypothetical protein ACP5GS_08790, partial [Nitrososphaeria archaeon]